MCSLIKHKKEWSEILPTTPGFSPAFFIPRWRGFANRFFPSWGNNILLLQQDTTCPESVGQRPAPAWAKDL